MLSAENAISRFHRDVTLAAMLRGLMLVGALTAMGLNLVPAVKLDGTLLLGAVVLLWVVLSYRSARGNRLAAESPSLIAAGQLEAAEEQIEKALGSFSLFRSAKLVSLHHLALLRHAQRRWKESAMLSQTLVSQRFGSMRSIAKSSKLLLADALLEMGDLHNAYQTIMALYHERLTLNESVNLLSVQLDYEAQIGRWSAMLPPGGTYRRIQLTELLPPAASGRAQALMALAAKRLGRADWFAWLKRRAELLAEPTALVSDRNMLREVWETV